MKKQKIFRVNEDILKKFEELQSIYNAKSENNLFSMIVDDIYEIKKSKALVPFKELDKRDKELQKAIFELGRLKGIVEEKEKSIEELKEKTSKKDKKGFWSRLFGL